MKGVIEEWVVAAADAEWVTFRPAAGGAAGFRRCADVYLQAVGRKARVGDVVRFRAFTHLDGTPYYYYAQEQPGEGKNE